MGRDKVLLKFESHNTFYGCLGCAETVFRNFTYNLITGNMGKNKQYCHNTLLFNKKSLEEKDTPHLLNYIYHFSQKNKY